MATKVIVVDDEQSVLNLLKSFVEPLGFEVLALADSREAARRLETEEFDGAILDVKMPQMDGFELCDHIRKRTPNYAIPIVMITGMDDVEAMRRGFRAGVTFFLAKPFTRDKVCNLARAIRGVILREKRRHARLPYRATVTCKMDDKHFRAGSVNLGEGGMVLEGSGQVPVGTTLGLEFSLPRASEPLRVRAKVVRNDSPDQTCVEFLDLPETARNAIQEFVLGKLKG